MNPSNSGTLLPARTHTRMDAVKASMARERALRALLPQIESFLGPKIDVSLTEPKGLLEQYSESFLEEGPPKYVDLEIGLEFPWPAEIWIDCLNGLEHSAVDIEHRFLFLFEPDEITKLRSKLISKAPLFGAIFTWDLATLSAIPKSQLFCHGGTWILTNAIEGFGIVGNPASAPTVDAIRSLRESASGKWAMSHCDKSFGTSFVCGAKRATMGHKLRHAVFDLRGNVSTPLKVYSSGVGQRVPLPSEVEVLPAPPAAKLLLFDTMFHLAIENVKQDHYFTEKLLDCFLTLTVPIYWGCPNIAEYFDVSGIIMIEKDVGAEMRACRVDDAAEKQPASGQSDIATGTLAVIASRVASILSGLSHADYEHRKGAIYRNYERALQYIDQKKRMESAVEGAVRLDSHEVSNN